MEPSKSLSDLPVETFVSKAAFEQRELTNEYVHFLTIAMMHKLYKLLQGLRLYANVCFYNALNSKVLISREFRPFLYHRFINAKNERITSQRLHINDFDNVRTKLHAVADVKKVCSGLLLCVYQVFKKEIVQE